MQHFLEIPHRRAHGMCPVNGIRDLIQWWSGKDWSNEFVFGLGQGSGFAYLRFNAANPPRQVYWGFAGPRQHRYLAELLAAEYTEYENRSFKFSWSKAREALDAGTPPVLGPLDMFHLHYYEHIYHQRHIPIHYLLLVGYDDENAYVHDTDQGAVQTVAIRELEPAWDVSIPGLGKRNRLVILDIPPAFPPDGAIIRKSIADECRVMLNPTVNMLGIPAMEKVAREIAHWPQELGEVRTESCLKQVREYLNTPPDLMGNHLTTGRDIYIAFLEEAGAMAGLDLSEGIHQLRESKATIPRLAEAIQKKQLDDAAVFFSRIAGNEKEAFTELGKVIGIF